MRRLFILCVLIVLGCQPVEPESTLLQGYIEGEFLYLASPAGGVLRNLKVHKGMLVNKGDILFQLDKAPEELTVREAEQTLYAAQARLKDLQKGQRPPEISTLMARKAQVETDLELAKLEQARYEALFRQKMIQKEMLDKAAATTERNQAKVEELEAQLQAARLSAREDLIQAAQAEVGKAQVNLDKAHWWLTQKQISAPEEGRIVDIFYYEGEWVPAANPVLSFLPASVKIRFFVPEWLLIKITVGKTIQFTCDGCSGMNSATVNYVASQAEYTPPVIYSRENRTKLVYMAEAMITASGATRFPVGLPVEVKL